MAPGCLTQRSPGSRSRDIVRGRLCERLSQQGLAPVGSLLLGTKGIDEARHKIVGGGCGKRASGCSRDCGAGEMVDDSPVRNARVLAGVAEIPGLKWTQHG